MKFLTIAFVVCAAISYVKAQEYSKEKLAEIAHGCQEESGASDDDLAIIMKHEEATSKEAKCMRACIMKKFGMMDESGHMNKEIALALAKSIAKGDEEKEKEGAELVESCGELKVPDDHCEASEAYAACMKKFVEGTDA